MGIKKSQIILICEMIFKQEMFNLHIICSLLYQMTSSLSTKLYKTRHIFFDSFGHFDYRIEVNGLLMVK